MKKVKKLPEEVKCIGCKEMTRWKCTSCKKFHVHEDCECLCKRPPAKKRKTNEWKCTDSDFCGNLRSRLQVLGNKGLVKVTITHTVTRDESDLVLYKKNKMDPGIALNFCPFCGYNWVTSKYEKLEVRRL